MSSVIHYKVKTGMNVSSSWQSIHFDGIYLPCLELKKRIIYREQWLRSEADATFDLQVANSQNAEEFKDEGYAIHRNVSVIVKRVPAATPAIAKRLYIAPGNEEEKGGEAVAPHSQRISTFDADTLSISARSSIIDTHDIFE